MGNHQREHPEVTGIARRQFLVGAVGLAAGGLAPGTVSAGDEAPKAAADGMSTVLITGASRGIGLEFAKRYAERGWRVIATCRNPDSAAALKELAGKSPHVVLERLDVVDHPGVDAVAARYDGQPIDVLLNNAGIGGGGENQVFGKLKYDVYPEVMKVNAEGPMPDRLVMGASTLDYDRDGDLDLFMAQDGFRGNVLLEKEDSGIYTDVSDEA